MLLSCWLLRPVPMIACNYLDDNQCCCCASFACPFLRFPDDTQICCLAGFPCYFLKQACNSPNKIKAFCFAGFSRPYIYPARPSTLLIITIIVLSNQQGAAARYQYSDGYSQDCPVYYDPNAGYDNSADVS